MPTIFSKIIEGSIPSYKIAESDQFYAFLDINPVAKGHTLVVPKKEVDYFFDLENDLLGDMMTFAKKVALAIEKTIPCERIGLMVLGLEVPHAHIHLVPLDKKGYIDIKTKVALSKEEMVAIAEEIRGEFEG